MPKEDVFVQVVCDDYVNIARRHENRWQLGFGTKTANHLIYTHYNNNITHWMPLPSIEGIKGNQGKISPIRIGDEEHIKLGSSEIPNNCKTKGGEL